MPLRSRRVIDSSPGLPRRSRARRTLLNAAVAVGGGAFWGALFSPTEPGIWALFGLVPLLWLARRENGARWAFVLGFVSWLVSVHWIVLVVREFGGLSAAAAMASLIGMCLILACHFALFAWLVGRLRASSVLWAAPALWVALEWSRTYFPAPFPWGFAGYAWVGVPGALALSSWIGVSGLSALLVLVAAGCVMAREQRSWRLGAVPLAATIALLLFAGLFRSQSPENDSSSGQSASMRSISIVQPNLPIEAEVDAERFHAGYQRLLELSRKACSNSSVEKTGSTKGHSVNGRLVIWPESAAFPFSFNSHERHRDDVLELAASGCDLLINSVTERDGSWYNSALLVGRDGVVASSDKRRLVPFGEYVPLEDLLPFVGKVARAAGRLAAVDRVVPIAWQGLALGPTICYEVAFPGDLGELTAQGADVLVGLSNDAWYGDDSWAQHQLLRAARFRAAENRRWLVRAALTGISAVVAPSGEVVSSLAAETEGVLTAQFGPSSGLSPFSRWPHAVPYGAICLALFAIVRALTPRGRNSSW